MKKFYLSLFFIVFLVCFGIYFKKAPSIIKKLAVSKIQFINDQKKIHIHWAELNIQTIPLKIYFKDIAVTYKRKIFKFDQAELKIALLQTLVRGHWMFNVSFSGGRWDIPLSTLSPSPNKNFLNQIKDFQNKKIKYSPFKMQSRAVSFFSTLPVHKAILKKGLVHIKTSQDEILLKNINFKIQNRRSFIQIAMGSPVSMNNQILNFQSLLHVQQNIIDLKKFHLETDSSKILLSGNLFNIKNNIQKAFFHSQIQLSGRDVSYWMNLFGIKTSFLSFKEKNFLKGDWRVHYSKKDGFKGPLDIELNQLKLKNRIRLSRIKLRGNLKKNYIDVSMAHLEKKGQTIFLENTRIDLNRSFSFKTKIYSHIQDFQSVEDMLDFNLGFLVSGPLEAECHGQILKFQIKCSSHAVLNDLFFKKSSEFKIPKLQFSSQISWNLNQLSIQGEFFSKNKTNIQFSILKKDKNLTLIPFNGSFNLSDMHSPIQKKGIVYFSNGSMKIHSGKIALFKSHIKTNRLSLSFFNLGNVKTKARWDGKTLHFKSLTGRLNKSSYKGSFSIQTNRKKPLITSQIRFSPLYLEDIKTPISMTGKGTALLSSQNSPLHDYTLSSSFKNVQIRNESFKKLIFNISSNNKKINFDEVLAEKFKGSIKLKGSLNHYQNLNVQIKGESLAIEKLENLKKWLNPHISGLMSFDYHLTGSLRNPKSHIQSRWTEVSYGAQSLGDSQIELEINRTGIQGRGDFFNDRLVIHRLNFEKPRLSAQFSMNDCNVVPLFLSSLPSQKIISQITGDFSLDFPIKNIRLLSGSMDIKKFILNRPPHTLKAEEPFSLQFDNGAFYFRDSSLKWKSQNQTLVLKKILRNKTSLSGSIRLEFIKIFLPFINNIQGKMQAQIEIQNHLNKLAPRGHVQIKNAVLNFIDSFDIFQSFNLNGQLTPKHFNIQEFTAQTATGSIQGKGIIDYSHKTLRPMDISARLNKINFYASDKIRLNGYGSLRYFGDQKPYFLSGSFQIEEGFFTAEFSGKKRTKINNQFLMPVEKKPNLFHLDISLNLINPFAIENSLIAALLDGSINVTGSNRLPLADGSLRFIPGGKFYIREYDFSILSGEILYNKSPFDHPEFNVTSQTYFEEIQYNQNQEIINKYDIQAEIKGYKDQFELNLTSQPPLSQQEILSMMALGARSLEFMGASRLSNMAQYSYSQIGYALFQSTIGRRLTRLLGIRFAVTPHINENTNKVANKVWFHKKWYKNLNTSVSTFLEESGSSSFNVEYNLTPRISLLGMWKENKQNIEKNILSLDVEYKWDFE